MPLQPELLYEPLQVAVKSMPTDWEALRFSAWTNATGAGVGALMGGLVSYWASVKAKLRVDTIKNAELVYRLARRNKSELHVIDKKSEINESLVRSMYNIRSMVEDYKDRIYEMCMLIEIRFPKEVKLVEGITEEVEIYMNERAVLLSMHHLDTQEAPERLNVDLSERVSSKSREIERLRRDLEIRLEKILERFKSIR